jgi:hypothetical protein
MPFSRENDDQPYHKYYTFRKSTLAVQALFLQPYWHRAWILQEIAVAKEATVYYGNHILPFQYIMNAHHTLLAHSQDCCSSFSAGDSMSTEVFPGWNFVLSGFLSIMQPVKFRLSHTLHGTDSLEGIGLSANLSLRELLFNARIWREATDPRDFVYSSLGLVLDNNTESIPIDYSASVAEVYSRAAMRVFEDDQDFSALEYHNHGRDNSLKIPSWVPDWRLKYHLEAGHGRKLQCAALQYSSFRAAKDTKFNGKLQSDLCLAVNSIKVDTITAIGSSWNPEFKEGERNWKSPGLRIQPAENIAAQISEWRHIAGLPEDIGAGKLSTREHQFWRTVFSDTIAERKDPGPTQYRRMEAKDFSDIKAFREQLRGMDTPSGWFDMFTTDGPNLGSFHVSTISRGFFATEGDQFGLALTSPNNNVMEGDEIHVIEGSSLPVILRRTEFTGKRVHGSGSGSAIEETKYLLSAPLKDCIHAEKTVYQCMGFAYVEGVMDGEAVDQEHLFSEVYIR